MLHDYVEPYIANVRNHTDQGAAGELLSCEIQSWVEKLWGSFPQCGDWIYFPDPLGWYEGSANF